MTTLSPEQVLERAFREGRVRMEPPCPECQCHVLPVGIESVETEIEAFGSRMLRHAPVERWVRLSCGHRMRAEYTLHVEKEAPRWSSAIFRLD